MNNTPATGSGFFAPAPGGQSQQQQPQQVQGTTNVAVNPAATAISQPSPNPLQQQQQLMQQLSQQLALQFPQTNLLSALANVQAQMQMTPQPQQQQQQQPQVPVQQQHPFPAVMALPPPQQQHPNLANVPGFMAPPPQPPPQQIQQQMQQQQQSTMALAATPQPPTNVATTSPAPTQSVAGSMDTNPAEANTTTTTTNSMATAKAPPSIVVATGAGTGEVIRAGFAGQPSATTPAVAKNINNNSNAATSDAERKKAPGSTIVPCRARGMPMDHNFKTAYFVIPENVRHGEELICSYFACRNAGVKFRYCSHCKVPVAKRNFRKRHKHGNPTIHNSTITNTFSNSKDAMADVDDDGSAADAEEGSATEEGTGEGNATHHQQQQQCVPVLAALPQDVAIPSQILAASRNGLLAMNGIPSQITTTTTTTTTTNASTTDNNNNTKQPAASAAAAAEESNIPTHVTTRRRSSSGNSSSRKPKRSSSIAAPATLEGGPSSSKRRGSTGGSNNPLVERRRRLWNRLLDKRPETANGPAMSKWLMQVLAVSDFYKPLHEQDDVTQLILGSRDSKDEIMGSSDTDEDSEDVSVDSNENPGVDGSATTEQQCGSSAADGTDKEAGVKKGVPVAKKKRSRTESEVSESKPAASR